MAEGRVYIIGVTPDGDSTLPPRASELIKGAEVVFGSQRLLALFPSLTGEKIAIRNNLAEVTDLINRNRDKRLVVLASGDPGFYGIAGYLTGKLGRDRVDIIPNVSSMQMAFARIRENWDDAALVSVHSRPIEDIVDTVRRNRKVGIFTDDKHTPAAIAAALLERGIDGYRAYVCQDLGHEDEKVIETDLHGLRESEFSPLNVLILLREREKPAGALRSRYLGIPDGEFHQRRPREGLITKQEVRAISIARMRLTADCVVWDIGAGSGAVSIEASFLAARGRVYAIEKNAADVAVIRKNIQKLDAPNVEAISAFAPDGLSQLPDPDAVFIGGSGGRMEDIIDLVCHRLKPGGRLVINVVALENLGAAVNALKARGFMPDVTLVNVARSTAIMELTRLEALNPVFVVAAGKEGDISS